MNSPRTNSTHPLAHAILRLAVLAGLVFAPAAFAAPSESGGSGVWDVPSADSKRAGHLGLGFFGSYQHFGLGDSLDTHLNDLRLGGAAIFGIPGGFELSGTLPIHGFYTSTDDGSSPFDENFTLRMGDLTGRLRWTTPVFGGLRWGVEGEATFPTGSDHAVTLPNRGTVRPFTSGKNDYAARSMLTWDARGAGRDLALRLHAGAGYHFQGDEGRYYNPNAPIPLDLPTPTRDKQNDFLSLFTAAELDLARVTLFGELSTDQYVNQRDLIKGKENRITVTPGIRFWLPGGLSLAGAYAMDLSHDDDATAFDPGRAFSDNQLRVALSLGTIYRNARAVREDAELEPMPASPVPAPIAQDARTGTASAAEEKERMDAALRARHETQDDKRLEAKAEPAAPASESRDVERAVPVPASPVAQPAPRPMPPTAPPPPAAMKAAPTPSRYVDTDGDGIPDAQDQCPLLAEDWDGFQDLDGCPDVDNDRDGIPDIRDQCPNDPETYNGYYDFDGCPDVAPGDRNVLGANDAPAPAPVPRAAAPPAAPTPLNAASATTDSLRRALAAQQARSMELSERLTRLEQAPPPAPPVAAADPGVDPALTRDLKLMLSLDAQQRANSELEARLRAVENTNRQPRIVERPAPVVVNPAPAQPGADHAARIRALESELAGLRAESALDARTLPPIPPPAAPAAPGSPEILSRLTAMQSSMDSLNAAQGQKPAPVVEEVPVADAGKTLDLMLPRGTARVFPEIQFESGSARLDRGANSTLDTMAQVLRLVPDARVRVVGHTDNVGRVAANQRLSRDRAQAVAEALELRGVSATQLEVSGEGESAPIASNATAAGRQANRRVEFTRVR